MALNPKNIIGTVTGAGKAAVSEVAGLAKRFHRGEDDTVIPTPEAERARPAAPPARPKAARTRRGEAQPLGRHEDRAREVRRRGHGDEVAPGRQAAQPDGGHRRPEGRCGRRPEVGDRAEDDREAEGGGRQAEARAGGEAQARGRDAEARRRRPPTARAEGPAAAARAEAGEAAARASPRRPRRSPRRRRSRLAAKTGS